MALKPALKERFTVVSLLPGDYPAMLEEIKGRIRAARSEKLEAADEELIVLYGDIGRTIAERCKDSDGVKSVLGVTPTFVQPAANHHASIRIISPFCLKFLLFPPRSNEG